MIWRSFYRLWTYRAFVLARSHFNLCNVCKMKLLITEVLEDFQGLIHINVWNSDDNDKNSFHIFSETSEFSSHRAIDFVGCYMHALPKHPHLKVNISALWLIFLSFLPQNCFCLIIIGVWEKKSCNSTSPLKLLARYWRGECYNMTCSEVIHRSSQA